MAFITPSDWSLGVEGTLAVRIPPSPSATRSVKVPPTSTPRRRSFTRSSLLLGDQPPFRGFLLVDVLAVGLGRQGVAHDAKRTDGGDVDGDQEHAQEERHAPAPGQKGVPGEGGYQGEGSRAEHEARWHPHLRPARVEAAATFRGVLDGHEHRAAPLSTEAETLEEAQRDEQDRGKDADGLIAREAPNQEGGYAHDQERRNQHRLASDPVPIVAEDHTAHGPGDEADGERGVRQYLARCLSKAREEHVRKDQGSGRHEDEVVVPLDGRPDKTGYDNLADRSRHSRVLPADSFHLRLLEREIPSVPKGLYRPGLPHALARRPSKPAPGTSTPCRSEDSLAPVVGRLVCTCPGATPAVGPSCSPLRMRDLMSSSS